MTVLFLDIGGDLAFTLGIHVGIRTWHLVPALLHDLLRLGKGDSRERTLRNGDLDTEEPLQLIAVPLLHCAESCNEEFLVQIHDRFRGVDPAHLGINRCELGRVPGRERRVGAERWANLKDAAKSCSLRHLLKKLGALCEICRFFKVFNFKELGT